MNRTYACPSCGAMLNPEHAVILIAGQQDARILVGFHPEPGVYEVHVPPGTRLEPGTRWSFACPVCQHDLTSGENENLCALEFLEGQERGRLLFSRVAGEHATFLVTDQKIQRQFGGHAKSYAQHFIQMKYLL